MPDREEPLIDDGNSMVLYFDGIADCENFHGVMRLKAFVRRTNPITGRVERFVIATLVRPAEGFSDTVIKLRRLAQGEMVLN